MLEKRKGVEYSPDEVYGVNWEQAKELTGGELDKYLSERDDNYEGELLVLLGIEYKEKRLNSGAKLYVKKSKGKAVKFWVGGYDQNGDDIKKVAEFLETDLSPK